MLFRSTFLFLCTLLSLIYSQNGTDNAHLKSTRSSKNNRQKRGLRFGVGYALTGNYWTGDYGGYIATHQLSTDFFFRGNDLQLIFRGGAKYIRDRIPYVKLHDSMELRVSYQRVIPIKDLFSIGVGGEAGIGFMEYYSYNVTETNPHEIYENHVGAKYSFQKRWNNIAICLEHGVGFVDHINHRGSLRFSFLGFPIPKTQK